MKKLNNVNFLDGIKREHDGLTVLPNHNYDSYFVLGSEFNVEVEFVWKVNINCYFKDYYKDVDYKLFIEFNKDFVDSLDLIVKDLGYNLDGEYLYLTINKISYKKFRYNGFNGKNGLIKIGDCRKFIDTYRENERKEFTSYYQSNFPTRYTDEEYSGFID